MKKITVTDISDLAYGKNSALSQHRTWFDKPIYSVDTVYEILLKTPGLRPTFKRWELINDQGYTLKDLEQICLQAKPKAPKATAGDVFFTLFVVSLLCGLAAGLIWIRNNWL